MKTVERDGVTVYEVGDGSYVAAWGGMWMPGSWSSVDEAVSDVLTEIAKG